MSEQSLTKRKGKLSRSGAGSGVYLKDEELEKAGLKRGDEVDISVAPDGTIVVKKAVHLANEFADALNTLEFGDPISVGGSLIIPIFSEVEHERDYITSREAQQLGLLRFSDSGRINAVNVTNLSDKGVLLIQGEILKGETQSRVVVTNMVLGSNESYDVPSRCVHDVHPISPRAPMEQGGIAPRQVAFHLTVPSYKVSQQRTWDSIAYFATTVGRLSFSEDFAKKALNMKRLSTHNLAAFASAASDISADIDEKVRKHAKKPSRYMRY